MTVLTNALEDGPAGYWIAARTSGADAVSLTKSNIRLFMRDVLSMLLIDVERICP
jgi:hypothetical protein